MKNSILRNLMLIAVLLTSSHAFAHDIEVDGIYYNFISTSDLTVKVTYKGSSYGYYSNEYMGSVVIPSTVTYNNRTLKVTSIGDYAFADCSSLTEVTIPNSVTNIGDYAFSDCSSLTSVTIGNSVTSIGNYAFLGCSSLTSVTIPNSVTSIGDFAFSSCYRLTSVTISNSVTSIGYSAFSNCSKLTSVIIPNSVTSIGERAFSGCSSLTNVTIPNSVTSIGEDAFGSCTSLTSVTIPNSVTRISNYTFSGCTSLTSITISNSVTSIGTSAFYKCSGLTSITIPNSVTSIGQNAFGSCTSLTSIIIPNSVTSIGESTFSNCSGLKSATIGSGVEHIKNKAFSGCISLSIINSLSTTPSSITGFDTKTKLEATLRIPKGSLASYQATDGWKDFWNIIEVENLENTLNETITIYNVNANYDANQGTVAINGVTRTYATVNANDKIEFKITPVSGYEIDKVMVNSTDITADVVDGKYTIDNTTEDVTLEVTFKEQIFAFTLKCSEAGAFKKKVKYGEVAEFEIQPSSNWTISSITFNGTDVTNELVENTYTTPAITCDSELNVVFVTSESSIYSVYNTSDVVVSASQQTIHIKGLEENTPVAVYNTNGQLYHSATATDYDININMSKEGVYLVKVGNKTFKVIL